ncbi:unnamed protein product [Owenia fusiformis]|uniref:Peptidase S1 domain-containing protein n=1 Tax=Owenia fusiformis TaxID=6347 RepID=A0A8S4P153_OWEFU|nr:unnamed protein product [Owenia fusiformis]
MTWRVLVLAAFGSAILGQVKLQQCGKKPAQRPWGTQIVNGRTADRGSWPWQISLRFSVNATGQEPFRHTCGGVLVHENWVLTAAHCIDAEAGGDNPAREDVNNFVVVLGVHEWNLTGSEQVVRVTRFEKHNRFQAAPELGFPNDIALIRLAEPAQVNRADIEPACLPDSMLLNVSGNPNCWISGLGLTNFFDYTLPDELQEAHIPVLTYEECSWEVRLLIYLRQTHLCISNGDDDVPVACQGDSGGPLSCLVTDSAGNERWTVSGITSFGLAGCEGFPSIYTKVASYRDWILDRIYT